MTKNTLIRWPSKKDTTHPQITKHLIRAHRCLAELKGIAHSLPNDQILLSNLTLQESKHSSEIENIITTQDSLYKHQIHPHHLQNTANKEIYNYSKALTDGCKKVRLNKGISLNTILKVQSLIEPNRPGFRKLPGTVLKNMATNKTVYTPPSPEQVPKLMHQLEQFINTNSMDPLIKMAVIHHCFESIHPFYDGNGRTGRIINILYLILHNLLDSPILYLSRYILKNRSNYYQLLREVRSTGNWTPWIVYMLKAAAVTSRETIDLINKIDKLFKQYKHTIRTQHKFYSHELINNIFSHPYTRVKFLAKDMQVSRATAARYLDILTKSKLLKKNQLGKENYYINTKLFQLLKTS